MDLPTASRWVLLVMAVSCTSPPEGPQALPPDAGERLPPPDDLVRVRAGDRQVLFRGPQQVKPECFGGHKGFSARAGEDGLHLNAFILEPGTYRCDDSLPVIFLLWQQPGSAEYEISPVEPTGGACELVVASVSPRMHATFSARLPRTSGEGPGQVELSAGELDLAMPVAACP